MSRNPAHALLAALLAVLGLVCATLLVPQSPATPMLAQAPTDYYIYTDALASGWQDWSWHTTVDLSNASPVHSGTASIAATYEEEWARSRVP